MNAIKVGNDVLAFLVEIAAIAALAVAGFAIGSVPVRILVGVGAPLLFIVVWALWLAPKSTRRLRQPWLLLAKIVLFGAAAVALYLAGHHVPAIVFGILAAVNVTLASVWGRL